LRTVDELVKVTQLISPDCQPFAHNLGIRGIGNCAITGRDCHCGAAFAQLLLQHFAAFLSTQNEHALATRATR
jgi:hypothetical protein